MRPLRDIRVGMRLFIVFRFALTWGESGLTVAAQSIVRRVEPEAEHSGGVAVEFERYRCLSLAPLDAAPLKLTHR